MLMVLKASKVDLEHIMSYPITQCPLSISHSDEKPLTTPKSKIIEVLEPLQDSKLSYQDEQNTTTTVIDGGLLLHAKLAVEKSISTYYLWIIRLISA